MAGVVTNLRSIAGGEMSANTTPGTASGSRGGEDNSTHVAVAIVALAGLAIAAGLVNIKLSAGRG